MNLYSRKLNNTEELAREKRKLQRAARQMKNEPMFGAAKAVATSKEKKSVPEIPFLSGPVASVGVSLLRRFLKNRKAAPTTAMAQNLAEHPEKAKITPMRIAKEVLIGYAKWKAVEFTAKLAYKGVKSYLEHRRAATGEKLI